LGGSTGKLAKAPGRQTVYATFVPLLTFQLPMIPALMAMENGAFSSEIGEAGRPIGAVTMIMAYLAIAALAFLVTLLLFPHRAPKPPSRQFEKLVNVLSFAMLAFYIIPVVVYKPAYLNGMTRYDFVDLPYVSFFNIKIYIAILCAYHGWMFALNRRMFHFLYFAVVVAAMVGWGEKFSGIMYAATFFITGLVLTGGFTKKLIIASMICVPISLSIWALPTYLEGRNDEVADAFENRLARQGQVFYKVIDEPPQGGKARTLPELLNYFSVYTPEQNGMPYLKGLYITPKLSVIHEGSFAAGYPAVFLTTGLVKGFVVVFFLEIIRFLLMREVFIIGFSAQNILLIPVYLYFITYLGKIYESGNTYLLTSPVFLGMAAIIIVGNRLKLVSRMRFLEHEPGGGAIRV
jgi:hypothetical protein